jgi:hypothetical protein
MSEQREVRQKREKREKREGGPRAGKMGGREDKMGGSERQRNRPGAVDSPYNDDYLCAPHASTLGLQRANISPPT